MGLSYQEDTIVAISTPPGRGAIGMVRLSGSQARVIVTPLLRLRKALAHAQARFAALLDLTSGPPHESLDEVVVTLFEAPKSFTTEDVVEISCHGSPIVLEYLVRQCMERGARFAEPGEFTQRAFLAGRLDLTQAEAVHDLIGSTTLQQARLAASQLGGSLSRQIAPVKEKLIHLVATLEAGIDFAEDDVDVLGHSEIIRLIEEMRAPLARLERSFVYGRLVHEGFSLALVGRPNAGKSSLFNALLGQDRAIVTSHPGTTRDLVRERLSLNGIPVELIDTAGIRDTDFPSETEARASLGTVVDEAERLGIAKSKQIMSEANVLLLVIDSTKPVSEEDVRLVKSAVNRPLVVALNKCDLLPEEDSSKQWEGGGISSASRVGITYRLQEVLRDYLNKEQGHFVPVIRAISTVTGGGLSELRQDVHSLITGRSMTQDTAPLTNLRQHESLTRSIQALDDTQKAAERKLPHEILVLHLHAALEGLDAVTGATTSDDVLERVFSTFCIGK